MVFRLSTLISTLFSALIMLMACAVATPTRTPSLTTSPTPTATPAMEPALAGYFAERYGHAAAETIRVVETKPWEDGVVVMYYATKDSEKGEWQWFAYLTLENGQWIHEEHLGGGSKTSCNRTSGGWSVGMGIYLRYGHVCDLEATQVRIVWRGGEFPPVVENLFEDGRFFTIHSPRPSWPPCAEVLDADGNPFFLLDYPPSSPPPNPGKCKVYD